MHRRLALALIGAVALAVGAVYLLRNAGEVAHNRATGSTAAARAAARPHAQAKRPPEDQKPDGQLDHRKAAVAVSALLPPPDTPLAQIYDELDARAAAGDAQAASRQYRDLMRCDYSSYWIGRARARASRIVTPDAKHVSEDELDFAQRELDRADKLVSLCAGLDPSVFDQITPVMLRAAKLGDPAARECYVYRGPAADSGSLLKNPQYLAQYQSEAPALIDAALAGGDWKMVDMLQHAYGSRAGGLVSGLVGADPVQHYRYLRLYSLGVDRSHDRGFLDYLDGRLTAAAQALSPEQIAQSDTWAQRELRQHFSGASNDAAPPGWNACAIPRDNP